MKKTPLVLLVALIGLLSLISAHAQVLTFNLDFGSDPNTAVDFTKLVPANFNTLEAESWTLAPGITLSFDSINNYTIGSATNPVIADGLFTSLSSTFVLSGLTPGSTVTLYAIDAWDGTARAAAVSFGGGALVSTGTAPNDGAGGSTPGLNVGPENMVLIASNVVVGGDGSLSGLVTSNGFQEGQLGGFIIQVTAVPEPSTWLLLGFGAAVVLVLRVRRRSIRI